MILKIILKFLCYSSDKIFRKEGTKCMYAYVTESQTGGSGI